MELPKDPFMLMSFLNMKLRDNYASLDALCEDLNLSKADIIARMNEAGFDYNAKANKFW